MIDSKTYHILVIEDNPGDFLLVEEFLFEQIESPVITLATSYKAAHDVLCNNCRFDIILLDLSLPDKTGEFLIREMTECCSSIPIIVLTGYADFDFGVRSLSLGISDYILKDELTSIGLYKSILYSCERKKTITALSESEKRYSELFHLSPLPMWVVDVNTLNFLDVNKATVDHYGYSRKELLSMSLKDIRPAYDIPDLERKMAQDKKNQRKHLTRETVHKLKNGTIRNVEIQIAPIKYQGIDANIVIATDITDRLNYIKAIEDQNEKLKEISWMQSHIIRAPLARIMGLIPLITDSNTNDEEKNTMLNYLTLSANELDEVIKNITDKISGGGYKFPDE